MKNQVVVTVIVPVFNVADVLRENLESIIHQTMKDIQIVYVDDGSKDGSWEILQEYAAQDQRMILLRQEHKGAGAARNYGLSVAEGTYLFFPDSDDVCDRRLLEKAVARAEETNADIVIYKAGRFADGKPDEISFCADAYKKENFAKEIFSYEDNPKKIFNSFQNWAWNKLFRRRFIQEQGICFQEIQRTNDLLFTGTAMVCAKRIALLDEMLYFYRTKRASSCQSTNSIAPLDFYCAFMALKSVLLARGIYGEVEESFVNKAWTGCLYNLRSLADYDARAYLFEFLKFQGLKELGILDFAERCPGKLSGSKDLKFLFSQNIVDYLGLQKGRAPKKGSFWGRVKLFYRDNGLGYTVKHSLKRLLGMN